MSTQHKTIILCALLVSSQFNDGVNGNPAVFEVLAGGAISIGVTLTEKAITNAKACGVGGGCHKGYCWTYCGLSLTSGDWCYTTKTYSQSFSYVECSNDSKCNDCWKCAGSCTL